jgi:hypothetical protein
VEAPVRESCSQDLLAAGFSQLPTVQQERRDTMIEVGSHTVLVFVKMQFLGQWSRFSGTQQIAYDVQKVGQLMVVTEDENAAKTTYWFKLDRGHEVWVVEDVVHIPAICIKSAPGDQIRCRG